MVKNNNTEEFLKYILPMGVGFTTRFAKAGLHFTVLTNPLRFSVHADRDDARIDVMTTPALRPELARAIANSMRLFGSIINMSPSRNDPMVSFALGDGYKIEMVPDEAEVLWSLSTAGSAEEWLSFDFALTPSQITFLADTIFIAADVEACAPVPGHDFPVRSPRL